MISVPVGWIQSNLQSGAFNNTVDQYLYISLAVGL